MRNVLDKVAALSINEAIPIWASYGSSDIELVSSFCEKALQSIISSAEKMKSSDGRSVARLLLLTLSLPRPWGGRRQWITYTWDTYVKTEKADIRKRLLEDLKLPEAYEKAFVDTLVPYLLSLDDEKYKMLKSVREASENNLKSEPILFLHNIHSLVKKCDWFNKCFFAVPLLLWVQEDGEALHSILREIHICTNLENFMGRNLHLGFLEAVGYKVNKEHLYSLTSAISTLAPIYW